MNVPKQALLAAVLVIPTTIAAEVVEVKYTGLVDLLGYECADTASSFVNRICFSHEKLHLVVLLKSTYYAYCGVDPRIAQDWVTYGSKGVFYNLYVKGRFDCREQQLP
ncbi:hypothetical protein MED193_21044 [Roseobacter sp. MED193]|uniref:KTSC domain-containing protein n=1 Tax=Roseobacter sp. MED193 TaxID=314262 RepID=UPI000068B8FD|nr:KTSC domain-containing protein [Roseobacter sp. MED193]EAQ47720.1 hypothetical protein MED193_21044 [Roseobacter sp. MED193]